MTGSEGYTLDYSGGVHPFGGAPPVATSAGWPGQDMADSIAGWTAARPGAPGGWVLDRHVVVHAYGSAPALAASATWRAGTSRAAWRAPGAAAAAPSG